VIADDAVYQREQIKIMSQKQPNTPQDYIDCYYSRSARIETSFPQLQETIHTPVCIVGGGMAGVATAQSLAERGINTILLEANRIAWGASGRNGGFVSAGYSLSPEKIAKTVGPQHARELYDLTVDAFHLIQKRIGAKKDLICESEEGILGTSWYDNETAIRNHVDFMNDVMGEDFQFFPRKTISEYYATNKYYDGYLKKRAMQIHALNYVCHAANTAQDAGARIFEKSPVTNYCKKGDHWHISTQNGRVIADQIILCCGIQTGDIQKKLARSVLSVSTFVLLTEPMKDKLYQAIRAPYAVMDNRFSSNYYRPLKTDHRLLWGGLVSMFNPQQDKLKKIMMNNLLQIYPQFKGVKADVVWGGSMGYPTHKMPQIGRLQEGLWYAQGFGGHGMTSTVAAGEIIASAIAEQDERYKLFEPFGLTYAGKPFGPAIAQTAYWLFQLRDSLQSFRYNRS